MGVKGKFLASMLGAAFLLLAGAAPASAVIRYAAPGGVAPATGPMSCVIATADSTTDKPCSIYEAAKGVGVISTDEVVIAPGDYSDTAGDLGPAPGSIPTPHAGNIHGAVGEPRPVIHLNNAGTVAFTVTTRLAHLELQSAMRSALIVLPGSGSVAEDLVVRSSADGGYVCLLIDGTLRDSACLAGGVGSRAVGSNPSGALTPKLRNVTAISSGSGGAGVSFDLVAGGSSSLAASVKSTIARATGSGGIDVKASESGGNTSIAIDHSNYVTTDDQSGAAPITDAGGHQTGAPALAADGYHELPSSNSTIDLGATDASSGSADIDGQFRSIERGCDPFGCPGGPHTDIGADELGRPTSLSVTCTPASLMLGSGISSCYVLARDIGNPSLFTGSPGGAVTYSSSGAGTFGAPFGPATCQLEAIGIGSQDSECTVAYTPSAGGTHQVTGVYTPDDRTHEPSQASAEIAVITPAAASTTAAAKKCKKGRKLVKLKGKKRCVKKKKRR